MDRAERFAEIILETSNERLGIWRKTREEEKPESAAN